MILKGTPLYFLILSTVKSFNFMGTKFLGLMMSYLDMLVDTRICGFQIT